MSFGGGRKKRRRSAGGGRERRMVAVTPLAPPPSRAHLWAFSYPDYGAFLGMSPAAVKKASQRQRVDLGSLESVIAFRGARSRRNGGLSSSPAMAIIWKRVRRTWLYLGELLLAEVSVDGVRWRIEVAEVRLVVPMKLERRRLVVLDVVGPTTLPVRVRGYLDERRFEGHQVKERRRG
jgi:hypothetical protein